MAARTPELLSGYLCDIAAMAPACRAEALGIELIRRRLARFSTQCYTLEQQLAGDMSSAAANAAAAQAQTTAQQLRAAIQQMSDKRVAHRLQEDLRQIVNSAIFVFGCSGMQLG